MTTAAIFALSSLAGSFIGLVLWRLWTQRTSNQEADQQVNDQIANGDFPVFKSSFHAGDNARD